jgi:hypothetical protein
MSERIHALAQEIFGKASVAACDLQEIKELVVRYPYFAPAHFLLLEKLRQEQDPSYSEALQKAVLLYHNPLEFEYFISSDKFYTVMETEAAPPAEALHEWQAEPQREEVETLDQLSINQEEQVSEERIEEATREQEPALHQEEIMEQPEQWEAAPEPEVQQPEIIQQEENFAPVHVDFVPEETNPDDQAQTVETIDSASAQPELPETGREIAAAEPAVPSDTIAEGPLAFEPFHTVDYFASQGIKLSQEDLPKDKLGRQLKSFTEWLKTMKRLPAVAVTVNLDPSSETNVAHMAEDSIHDTNIVTEAMAEVWLKQGNKPKALEVYNKLSLLNPSKRAYFAGLIENLKHS